MEKTEDWWEGLPKELTVDIETLNLKTLTPKQNHLHKSL